MHSDFVCSVDWSTVNLKELASWAHPLYPLLSKVGPRVHMILFFTVHGDRGATIQVSPSGAACSQCERSAEV